MLMNFLAYWVNDTSFAFNESGKPKGRKKFAIRLKKRFCFNVICGQQNIMTRTLTEQSLRQIGKQEGNYAAVLSQATLWLFQGVSRIELPVIRLSLYGTNKLVPGSAKLSNSS